MSTAHSPNGFGLGQPRLQHFPHNDSRQLEWVSLHLEWTKKENLPVVTLFGKNFCCSDEAAREWKWMEAKLCQTICRSVSQSSQVSSFQLIHGMVIWRNQDAVKRESSLHQYFSGRQPWPQHCLYVMLRRRRNWKTIGPPVKVTSSSNSWCLVKVTSKTKTHC